VQIYYRQQEDCAIKEARKVLDKGCLRTWFRRWRDRGQRAAQQRAQLRRAAAHHGRWRLRQAVARWKAHHLGCVRKRVRQAAAPRPETTAWGRGGLSGKTHDRQDAGWLGSCGHKAAGPFLGRLREASLCVGSPPGKRWPSRETWLILKHGMSELGGLQSHLDARAGGLGFVQDSSWGWEDSSLGPGASHAEAAPR